MAAAATAFEEWKETTPSERSLALFRIADAVEARAEELIAMEVANTGQPIHLTRSEEIGPMVDQILADEQVGDDVLWALTDHLGTVRDIIDGSAAIDNHSVFDAYGTHDRANRLTSHTFADTAHSSENDVYSYDNRDQLTSVNTTEETYTYDSNGNRTLANGSTYTTGSNNRLTSDSAEYYQAAGLLVLIGNVVYDEPARAHMTALRGTYYLREERIYA